MSSDNADGFEFDFDSSSIKLTRSDLAAAFKEFAFLDSTATVEHLDELITIGNKFNLSAVDIALSIAVLCQAKEQNRVTKDVVQHYRDDLELTRTADITFDFISKDFNRELDITTKHAITRAGNGGNNSGNKKNNFTLHQSLQQPSPHTPMTMDDTSSTHDFASPLKDSTQSYNKSSRDGFSPVKHNTTPTSSARLNASVDRSQWTSLLQSPTSTFPEHHQKGQVLVRFAPLIPPKISNSNTTMFDDVENETPSTSMNDTISISSSLSKPTPEPRTPPIYIVSWIKHALQQHRTTLNNPSMIKNQHLNKEFILNDIDPLKPTKAFKYMNWDHSLAIDSTISRESDMADHLLNGPAIQYDLAMKSYLASSKPTTATATPTSPAQNQEQNDQAEDDDLHQCPSFNQQQIQDIWYVGHIKNTLTSSEKRLTSTTVILSNYETEVPLRLTHKALQHYSLFPGQIIACRGTNVTGSAIVPDLIITETLLSSYQRQRWLRFYWNLAYAPIYKRAQLALSLAQQQSTSSVAITAASTGPSTKFSLFGGPNPSDLNTTTPQTASESTTTTTSTTTTVTTPMNISEQIHQSNISKLQKELDIIPTLTSLSSTIESRPVKVMYCNGPYVSSKGTTQAISAILDQIQNELVTPDVLILSGPFVDLDAYHLKVQHNQTLLLNTPDFDGTTLPPTYTSSLSTENGSNTTTSTTSTTTTTTTSTTIPPTSLNSSEQISLCNVPVYKTDIFQQYNQRQDANISLYHELFQETLDRLITQLNLHHNTQNISVITVPSPRDIHHYACFPQPGYEYAFTPPHPDMNNTVKVYNAPNPCVFDINGTVFGISTNDALAELSKYELFMQNTSPDQLSSPSTSHNNNNNNNNVSNQTPSTPSKNDLVQLGHSTPTTSTPTPTSGMHTTPNKINLKDKRTVRLISHFLSQQSFSPITTTPNNITLQSSQARTSAELFCKPDILLLPSKIRYFVESVPSPGHLSSSRPIQDPSAEFLKENGHILAINPNSVISNEQLGTFAQITIYAPSNSNSADIIDRARVEIIHL